MSDPTKGMTVRGRGAAGNPGNRFEQTSYAVSEWDEPEDPSRDTVFLKDTTRSIITYNDSPDVGFDASINPYRGCEHGCIYCFARPNHEYLGFSAGLDFESRILVKEDAPELLRQELMSPKWEAAADRDQRGKPMHSSPLSAGLDSRAVAWKCS